MQAPARALPKPVATVKKYLRKYDSDQEESRYETGGMPKSPMFVMGIISSSADRSKTALKSLQANWASFSEQSQRTVRSFKLISQ